MARPRKQPPQAAPAVAHVYEPVGSARDLFLCQSPEVLLSGSAGTGKSRACLEKLLFLCLAKPGTRAAILRKTASSLTGTALATWDQFVGKEYLANSEITWFGGSARESPGYRFGNGSTIVTGGLDKPDKIMSSEWDIAYIQEATELELDDWEKVTTRLRNGVLPFQQLIADCNPNAPQHWLNQRCIAGQCKMVLCRHEDNPKLWDNAAKAWTPQGESYISVLENLTGVRYQRLRLGIWAAADGLVYPTFDPRVHLGPVMDGPPPKEWDRYISVDFGFNNPFVAQFWAEDHDGRLHLWKEIYKTETLVEDHAQTIKYILAADPGRNPRAIICDHDLEDRRTLERHLGMGTIAATKDVSTGIQAVQERLRVKADGFPGLIIHRGALHERDSKLIEAHKPACCEEEFTEYCWEPNITRGINTGVVREAPLKKNDHSLDALRYLVAYFDLKSKPKMRVLTW